MRDHLSQLAWKIVGVAALAWPWSAVARADVPPSVLESQQRRIEVISHATQSSISVFEGGGQGGGSGVVITPDGYALSNFHVTKPAGNYMQCSMSNGKLYDAVIVGLDPTGDVSLLKLLGRDDFPCATMADSDDVRVGDWCFAIGNPFLLATDFQPTVTYGIVSGVHRYQYPAGTLLEYADCLQTDASINPGNSGGPLFNANGNLIGINGRGSFEKRGRVNVGVGYAISINQIKNFLGYLRSGRIVDHATLGASVSTDDDGRVIVTNILESSDAYRRGLRYGDEIVTFGGRAISTVNGFKNALGIFPRGWRVPLAFRRDDQRFDVMVRLAGVHSYEELLAKTQGAPAEHPVPQPRDDHDGAPPEGGPHDETPQEDGAQPQDEPPPSRPLLPGLHRKQEIPSHVADQFVARRGYANYHFNRLNRNRVWDGFTAKSDFVGTDGPWVFELETDDGTVWSITLEEERLTAVLPTREEHIDPAIDLDEQLGPPGSGGLFVALHLWHRMLTIGPERYGEVYYLGTAPMAGRNDLVDVLVAIHNVVETKFMFDPSSGELLGMEMFPERDVDPCEIYFRDYVDRDGRLIPQQIEVRHGDQLFRVITIQELKLPQTAENPA